MFEKNQYLNIIYEPYHLNALGMCHSVLGYVRKILITFLEMNSSVIFFYNFSAEAFPRTFTRVFVINKGFHSSLWCSLICAFGGVFWFFLKIFKDSFSPVIGCARWILFPLQYHSYFYTFQVKLIVSSSHTHTLVTCYASFLY